MLGEGGAARARQRAGCALGERVQQAAHSRHARPRAGRLRRRLGRGHLRECEEAASASATRQGRSDGGEWWPQVRAAATVPGRSTRQLSQLRQRVQRLGGGRPAKDAAARGRIVRGGFARGGAARRVPARPPPPERRHSSVGAAAGAQRGKQAVRRGTRRIQRTVRCALGKPSGAAQQATSTTHVEASMCKRSSLKHKGEACRFLEKKMCG